MVTNKDSHKENTKSPIRVLVVFVNNIERDEILSLISEKTKVEAEIIHNNKMSFWKCGVINNVELLALQTDMGSSDTDGATLATFEAIEKTKPQYVFSVGIAFGCYPNKQSIGDILISAKVQNYEKQRVGTTSEGESFIINRGQEYNIGTKIKSRLKTSERSFGKKTEIGIILSGEKLIDNKAFKDQLIRTIPEAIGGEMEAVGIASACERCDVEWAIIKAVCDFADGKKKYNKKKRQVIAARNSAEFLIHLIEHGGLDH